MSRWGVIRFALILGCLALAGAAGVAFSREYRVTYVLRGRDTDVIQGIIALQTAPEPVQSLRNQRDLLADCAGLGRSNLTLLTDRDLHARFDAACQAIADAILQTSPASARALAMRLAVTGPVTAGDYATAMAAAPGEPWPLSQRLMALEHAVPLPADLAALAVQDIDRALGLHWGRQILAEIYLRSPDLRPVIESRAETRSPDEQRDFLNATKKLAAGNG